MSRQNKLPVRIESLEVRNMLTAAVSGTDVLATFGNANGLSTVSAYLKANPTSELAKYVSMTGSKQLFAVGKTSMVQLHLKTGANAAGAIKLLAKVPGAKWASPNFVYGKQGGEAAPTDPLYPTQVDPLANVDLERAWDVTTGNSNFVVAVLDDGFDYTHEDLAGVAYTNPGEIAGDNIDNDNNGYVDDVRGWDFAGNDNNVAPAYDSTYGFYDSHGTQVATTIAAVRNNGVGIAGVANVKILPIRFRGSDTYVTSANIASSIAYAANMGAKVMNLSFSFDPYMNDPAFTTAVDLAYNKGVLWLNSAGNANVNNPPRTLIDKAIFVDNVDDTDVKNPDSNYGTGTDVSAPGTEVMTASPVNSYYPSTGTSFSTAVTSGVAALIWSAHPTWTRDQVAAQLLGSADSIDALNPGYEGLLGTGRVNAYKAVSSTLGAPTMRGLLGLTSGGAILTPPSTISIGTFSVLDPATIKASAFEVRSSGTDNVFGTTDDVIYPVTAVSSYAYGSNDIDLTFAQNLPNGNYRFTAKTTITDPFGTALAAPVVKNFSVVSTPPTAPTGFTAVITGPTQTEVKLNWVDSYNNETGFVIERSTSSTFATIDKTFNAAANSVQYNDINLTQGQTYYYRIRAVNAAGQGQNTAPVAVTVPLPVVIPATPTALTVAAGATGTDAVLKWTDNATNETGYVIQRSTSSTFATVEKTFNAPSNSVTYTDKTMVAGTTYYFRVQAINGTAVSAFSNVVTIKATVTPPAAPTGLTVTALAGGKATVKWADNSTNETGFVIERYFTFWGLLFGTSKSAAANTTTFNDTGLIAGYTYYYRIRAINSAGGSAWTSYFTVKGLK